MGLGAELDSQPRAHPTLPQGSPNLTQGHFTSLASLLGILLCTCWCLQSESSAALPVCLN